MSRWHGLPFVDTCRHPTSLNIPYRILPFSTRYHQNDPEWEAAKPAVCCQSWSILILRSMVRVLFLENNGKHPRRKTEGPERQSLVALALTRKSLPAEWQSGPLKNELCDAMWCFDTLCVEMRSKAFQPEFTKHAQYTKNQIKSKNDIASQLTDLTISHPVSMPHDSTSKVTSRHDSLHSWLSPDWICQPGAEISAVVLRYFSSNLTRRYGADLKHQTSHIITHLPLRGGFSSLLSLFQRVWPDQICQAGLE